MATDPTDCRFDNCGERAHSKGLCVGHYFQQRKGQVLRPLKPKKVTASIAVPPPQMVYHKRSPNQNGRAWTPEEDELLRENLHALGEAGVARMLNRTAIAVHIRASKIRATKRRRWSKAEDNYLVMHWADFPLNTIAKALGRPRDGCYLRAVKLGLKVGVPEGMESVTASAERTGFDRATLQKVLRWAGVDVERTLSRVAKRASFRKYFLDPVDVDEAIELWGSTETLSSAVRRHGIPWHTLNRWLRASGAELLPRYGRGGHLRVSSSLIDDVVAKNRSRETMTAAARRMGLNPGTLQSRLQAAGVARSPGKLWFVDRITAERFGYPPETKFRNRPTASPQAQVG